MKLQIGTKSLDKTRWLMLVASLLLMSTLGIGYVWSLYVGPMIELRGATEGGMASIYTALTLTGALLTIVSGKCVEKFGSTKVILSTLVTVAIGLLICGFTKGVAGFAIAEVVFLAWQQSALYIAVYANIVKLFPDWKGLALSISAAGIAIGGAYLPVIVQSSIDNIGFDVQFVILAAVMVGVGLVGLIFFPEAPDDYVPEGYIMPDYDDDEIVEDGKFVQKDWKMMLKDPAFYIIFVAPILGTSTYMLLSYQLSWIAQDMLGITAMESAFLVSGVSIMGIICIVTGPLSDRMNRVLLFAILFALGTVCVAGLIFAGGHGVTWFAVCAFAYCFCFGSVAGIHPAIIADLFGSKHYSFNYSICYQSVLIAAAISPWLGVLGGTDAGDYTKTFTICTIMCGVGAILMFVLYIMRKGKLEPKIVKEK